MSVASGIGRRLLAIGSNEGLRSASRWRSPSKIVLCGRVPERRGLAAILAARPELRGVVFDLPNVVTGTDAKLRAAGVIDRCEVVAGDFFMSVPSGADCYILANVLHDWDDDRALAILRNCRRAMLEGGKVLVVERMILADPAQSLPTLLSDINMVVMTGGRERTNDEYARLFADADLCLTRVLPVLFPYGVFEGSQK